MKFSTTHTTRSLGVALALVLTSGAAVAGLTGLAQVPLLSIENTGTVKPNLMVVYDNSGSMAFTVTPDYVDDGPSCRSRESMNAGATMACAVGHPPYHSADFNKQYYNPAIVYSPPVLATGGFYPNITSFDAVKNDAYDINTTPLRGSGTTINLVTDFPDLAWCKNSTTCARNTATTGYKYPDAVNYNLYITKTKTVSDVSNVNGAPYYYTIGITEYCKTANLTDCKTTAIGAAVPASYPYPAKVRWCKKKDLATCQAKYIQSSTVGGVTDVGFTYPRFGDPAVVAANFVRTDIVSTRTTYPKVKARIDCVASAGSCSYAEEMTNFANWYTYYRTRNQAMKTAVGLSFNPVSGNYNAGLVGLAQAAAIDNKDAVLFDRPLPFTGKARIDWYNNLYGMVPGGATPLRLALHAVGRMFASQKPFDTGTAAVQFPCQQNFTFLTTDGLWNGPVVGAVANNDNKENASRFCTKAKGCVDPRAQTDASLADIALYWYNGGSSTTSVSLRPDLEDMSKEGLVKGPKGDNQRLHMNTYTLGLGVDGLMNYEPNYDTAPVAGGDFSNVVNGVTSGCPWNNNGAYTWPDAQTEKVEGSDTIQSRVDDLWHTAINGRGKYFSAADPTEVIAGLKTALSFIDSQVGAASSAATSTPNITLSDNDIFSNTFTTVQWSGELTNKKINVVTGAVGKDIEWSTSKTLGARVSASSDTRIIKMLDVSTKTLKDFTFANLPAADKLWFQNQCSILAQCTKMSDADKAIVNQGATIVNWLRGQTQYADNVRLRAYGIGTYGLPLVLGDIASSKPAYVRVPSKNYAIAGYADFVIDNTLTATNPKRKAAVYVAANDGMLHAFDAATGAENWAYVPRITMKKLAFQASTDYGTNHQYTTDGSPEVADVQINGVWKSVLVAGLNAGGRGYYALDVTDPANPKPLWETCADSAVCADDNLEPELGLTFGNPQMGLWKDAVGTSKWVAFVASGYNNVPNVDGVKAGSGKGWLMILDIATGKVLEKVATPVQDGVDPLTTPSGLARITGISLDPATDPKITYIYGGDNLGQMWRFDLTKGGKPTVTSMGNAGVKQPITTRPDVTMCKVETIAADKTVTSSNKVVVVFPTGRLLDVADVSNKDTQSLYVMRDSATNITDTWRGTSMAKRPVTKVTSATAPDSYTVSGTTVDLSTQIGWYTDLDQNKGERVTVDPKIVTGSLNVVSNVPDASAACTVGGKSVLYQFDICSGTGALNTSEGGGGANNVVGSTLSSSSAAVGFIVVSLPNGAKKIIATLADGTQLVVPAGDLKDPVTRRAGWRRIKN
jgi:type IV pilus assembly protein PilY1